MSEIVIGVIGVVSGFIGVYGGFLIIEKRLKRDASNMVLDILDDLTPELPKLLAKEEVRQFIYSLGVLAGNGAKAGAFGTAGKGKFKFEDLLGQILPQVLPKFFNPSQEGAVDVTPGGGVEKW